MTFHYQCPLCATALTRNDNTFACEQSHQFDCAKEGYVNLLPVQFKKSKQPGDNLEMVQARRQFLAGGHYEFLRQALWQQVQTHTTETPNTSTIYDLGCGEGYYTSGLKTPDTQVYGIDIAKPAIRYAAKRYPDCHFSVASIKNAPLVSHSANAIVSVFAPVFSEEMARLLAPAGKVFVVSPAPRHLYELKAMIYNEVRLHTPPAQLKGLSLQSHTLLSETLELDGKSTEQLIKMTPFAWKFTPAHWQKISQQNTHQVTAEFYLTQYQKIS